MAKSKRGSLTSEQEFGLADLVGMNPMLWNSTLEIYKRSDLKKQTWIDIALQLGLDENAVDMLMNRFKSMRETFADNFRRVEDSKRSGSGTADVYQVKWKLWPNLQYLHKVNVVSASKSNIPASLSSVQSYPDPQNIENSCEQGNIVTIDGDTHAIWDPISGTYMLLPQVIHQTNENSASEATEKSQMLIDESETEACSLSENGSINSTPRPTPCSTPSSTSRSSSALGTNTPVNPRMTVRPGPSSAPVSSQFPPASPSFQMHKKDTGTAELYQKRGANKKRTVSAIDEALTIFKEIAKEPEEPARPLDAADHLAQFIAARLRRITDEKVRKDAEDQLMTVMLKF